MTDRTARLRALARLAWRDARLHRGRSVLVAAMVALPVAALTVGLVYFNADAPSPAQRIADVLGRGDVTVSGDDPAALRRVAAAAPPGSTVTVRTTVTAATVTGGRRHTVVIDDVTPDDPVLAPRYQMVDGRPPTRPGEVVIAQSLAQDLGSTAGDTIRFTSHGLELTVTGIALRPERLNEPFALVAPGTLDDVPGAVVSGVYLDLPDGTDPPPIPDTLDTVTAADVADRSSDRAVAFGSMFALAVLGLAETGMVVVAAFLVGAQRRLRRVGLVFAAGGEPAHARTMVLLEGAVLGLIGAVAGVALGLAVVTLLAQELNAVAGRVISRTPLPVPQLLGAVALGVAAATLAVLGQARLAARVGAVDALAGRTPPPSPPRRSAGRGAVAAAAGAGTIALGSAIEQEPVQVLGVGLMVAGALLAVPALVAVTGRLGSRLPLALRLAARDTARHSRRTWAAVAGAALALALPVTMATLTLTQDAQARTAPPLAADQVLISADNRAAVADTERIDAAVRSVVDVVAAAPMRGTTFGGQGDRRAQTRVFTRPGASAPAGTLVAGDADLLRALHAEDRIGDLRAGRVVAIGDDLLAAGTVHLADDAGRDPVEVPAVASRGPGYDALPRFVVSPQRAAELGLHVDTVGQLLYRAATPVDGRALDRIRAEVATVAGIWVLGAEDTFADSTTAQAVLIAAAVPVALATLAVATAMIVAESGRDRAVLVAVGAGPGLGRRIAGAAALLLGLLAAAIAIPTGYVPVALLLGLGEQATTPVVPWLTIGGVVGAAALAGLATVAVTRQPAGRHLLHPPS